MSESITPPVLPDPPELARPTRAELRREREARVHPLPAASAVAPVGDSRTASRQEQRRLDQQRERQLRSARGLRGLLTTWWVYPLAAMIAVCLFLGLRSASTPLPSDTPIVVTTPSVEP